MLASGGIVGHGGAVGTGGKLGAGGSLAAGGSTGLGGTIGQGGAGGADAPVDVPATPIDAGVDVPAPDVAMDGTGVLDGGVTLAMVEALIANRCAGCHSGTGAAATRLDLSDHPDAGSTLYARLLGPVLLETYCGENVDAGGDAAAPHRAIVPGDPAASFLYLKITGTQPSPGTPPANCGSRMPRVFIPGVDGGAATQPACDTLDGGAAANCLGEADIALVRQWILEGAPAN